MISATTALRRSESGPATAPTISIGNMTLLEEVGRGARSVVYRATFGDREYAVKFHNTPRDLATAERQFRREAALHGSINHPVVPNIFEVGLYGHRPYIISEFVRGQTLAEILAKGPVGDSEAIRIGVAIGSALEVVHRHGLVHRDIKPRNILISERGEVRLIDFGLAGTELKTAEGEVVGTFRYCAPEQTGMLERPVDCRADLYALGNVLYECVAGWPPFRAADIATLLHQHAAIVAEDLQAVQPGCSPALVVVIHRLLLKDPEERYQSARALVVDLSRAADHPKGGSDPVQFVVSHEAPRPSHHTKLVGRSDELLKLQQAAQAAKGGSGQVVVVEGPAGIGKTRLVEEFIDLVLAPDSTLFSGRCSESERYPLASFRHAIRSFLRRTDRLPVGTRQMTVQNLALAAEGLEPILAQMVPELGQYFDAEVAIPSGRMTRELLSHALTRFLVKLADLSHFAVVWLDNVQCMDEGSANLLQRLASEVADHPVLVVVTAQTTPKNIAFRTVTQESTPASSALIALPPISPEDAGQLVLEILGGPLEEPYSTHFAHQSRGNPFLLWQYILAARDAGVLFPNWGTWMVDEQGIRSLPLPSDLLSVLESRVEGLEPTTRQVLGVACLLGTRFKVDQLQWVWNRSDRTTVQQALRDGLEAQLITYSEEVGGYSFLHERLREALLARLDEFSLHGHHLRLTRDGADPPPVLHAEYHQRAAEYLESQKPLQGRDIFEYARHIRAGYGLSRPERSFSACLDAAILASADYAFREAHEYLSFVSGPECLEPIPSTQKALYFRTAGAAAFHTDRVAEAIEHFRAALELTLDKVERADLRAEIARATIFNFNTAAGTVELEQAFDELQRPLPSARFKDVAILQPFLALLLTETLAGADRVRDLETLDPDALLAEKVVIRLCDIGFLVGYYDRNIPFAMQCGILAMEAALKLGQCSEACQGFSTFAWLMGVVGRSDHARKFSVRALAIAESGSDRNVLAATKSTCAIALHLAGDADGALALQREVFEHYADYLSPLHFQNCCVDLAANYFSRGLAAEELHVSTEAVKRLERQNGAFMAGYLCRASASQMSALATLGRLGRAAEAAKKVETFREIVPPNRAVPWISVAGFKVNYYLQQSDVGPEFEAAVIEHQRWGVPPERSPLHSKHFYLCHAYARLEKIRLAAEATRNGLVEAFEASVRDLEVAATTSTFRAHLAVLKANLHLVKGETGTAQRLLGEATELIADSENPWALFEETVTRAHLRQWQGREFLTTLELQRAHAITLEYGWQNRKLRIERDRGSKGRDLAISGELSQSMRESHLLPADLMHLQKQLDALMALSRASASVLDPHALYGIALDECARLLGAERAYLFIADQDQSTAEFKRGRSAEQRDLGEPSAYSRTIVDRVFSSGQAVLLSTRADAQALESESVVVYDLRSVLAAPLSVTNQVLGVIYLDNRLARGIFNQQHADLLRAMGSLIATSLQTARSAQLESRLKAEKERYRLAETLRELNAHLNSTLNLNEGLQRLVDSLARELAFDNAVILMHGENGLERVSTGNGDPARGADYWTGSDISEPLMELTEPTVFENPCPDLEKNVHWLLLPLRSRDSMIGLVGLKRSILNSFSQNEIGLGMALVGQAGIAIDNARLFSRTKVLAEMDGLTGLLNRREFFRRGNTLFQESLTFNSPISAIMLDVDHFKRFNDTYGHATGDLVLKEVALLTSENIRRQDLIGRYGGEEFAIILPGAAAREAAEIGERIRGGIASARLRTEAYSELSITISVGVAEREGGEQLGMVLSRADKALYVCKARGRNVVTVAPSSGS